jgi:hypothetical protein
MSAALVFLRSAIIGAGGTDRLTTRAQKLRFQYLL